MDFVFQGFQSALPLWIVICLAVCAVLLAWWSYKNIHTLSPLIRYALTALRALVFLILLVLLLNPFYKSDQVYYKKPTLLFMMDNSASTSIHKGAYKGKESYQELLDKLNVNDSSRLNYSFYAFDRTISPIKPDSLSLDGSETNLYNVITKIQDSQQDINAAVLISDGIFNQGRNPVFEAAKTEVPIFTIALGDTVQQKDLVIKSVTANNTGYVNTSFPVQVSVGNQGFIDQPFRVELKRGAATIASKTVRPADSASVHTLNFEIKLTEEGLQQYQVVIPALKDEWTKANNEQPFFVNVLDEKQRILSVAFEIHPDVQLLRSFLLKDENSQLSKRTWLGGSRFIEGSFDISPDSLDLIILQGYPGEGLPQKISQQLNTLVRKVPLIVIATPLADIHKLEIEAGINLPIQYRSSPAYETVSLDPVVEPSAHPVMELPAINFSSAPTLYAPISGLNTSAQAKVLFESLYQGTKTHAPLLAVEQTGNIRRVSIAAYGWYRMAQNPNSLTQEFTEKLFYNLVSWAATKADNQLLNIQPAQKIFTGNEPVALNAFLKNERGEKETEADIEVSVSGEGLPKRFYSMQNEGNGEYSLQVGTLPKGLYMFEATAKKGSRTIDAKRGEFSVSGTNIEFVETRRNDRLLRQIAEQSGGSYFTFSDVYGFWKELENKKVLDKKEETSTTLFYPYQHLLWLIIVIVLLGTEWITRKYFSLP